MFHTQIAIFFSIMSKLAIVLIARELELFFELAIELEARDIDLDIYRYRPRGRGIAARSIFDSNSDNVELEEHIYKSYCKTVPSAFQAIFESAQEKTIF